MLRGGEENSLHALDCQLLQLRELISIYFSGVEIKVPVRDLVMQLTTGCYLSLTSTDNGPIEIGQNILKSTYLVVDLKEREISLAQAYVNDQGNDSDSDDDGSEKNRN